MLMSFGCAAALPLWVEGEIQITSDTFGGLQARALGPAVPSGRIAAIDAVATDPLTIYIGSASGGIFKSTDGGTTFKPRFDEHTLSIGAVRVDPSDPKTVWVGTGESWTRNSTSVGTGIYKTSDGGDSWNNMGLKDSERIARIQVDPKAPGTVYVCATGHLWNANQERGVYKTTDGGKSWERVLYVDPDTGCSDLSIDPQDPRILYAGLWQFRRRPDFFASGGKGSGLYKSSDSGATWKRLIQGLPAGELGRIAVTVAPSRPSVVYAVVESKKTALYRSDDSGTSWVETNSSMNVQVRPFYFATLTVDPTDFNTVYKPGFTLAVSTDGGQSFTSPFSTSGFGEGVHPDHHALWINPNNPSEMLLGTDGGLYISYDQAHHWLWAKNLPVAQFYHVSYDMETPYNVYGGLQDNGSWKGPSRSSGGIEGRDWDNIGDGDGFWAFVDPKDPGCLYSEYQGGEISRVNQATGEVRSIKPYAAQGEKELRFNWNTPISISPTDPGTLYFGAQFLFRTRDRGESWQRISPDLTTNDPARQKQAESGGINVDNSTAENNTTIYCISESPKNHDLVWAGTDDGNLQITRDGGQSWSNVVGNVPGVPKLTWVSSVQAGNFAEGTAYVTFDGHRSGDMRVYVFRTTDYGATWQSLVTPEIEGYAWVIREDLVNPNLLFLGTEFGLYISLDGGQQWARFSGNLPKAAVHDLAIHPRENDLIIATHGRGIYILDDLTPIRALTQEILNSDVALLPSRPAAMPIQAGLQNFTGDDEFIGSNPQEAASITYWLKKRHLFGDLKVEVYDGSGQLISTISGTKRVGINRIDWPMRLKPPKLPPSTNLVPAFTGPRVAEGSYSIKLIKAKSSYDGSVELEADPRSTHSPEDRVLQQKTAMQLYNDLERLTYVADSASKAQKAATNQAEKLGKGDRLKARLTKLASSLEEFTKSLAATSEAGWLSGEEKLREKLGQLYGAVNQYDGRPTDSQLQRRAILEQELQDADAKFQGLVSGEVAAVNAELTKKKLEPIPVLSLEEWRKAQEAGPLAGSSSIALSAEAVGTFAKLFPSFWKLM
jgi:photosystem II stability/assembly factor-like uncharacterized protein